MRGGRAVGKNKVKPYGVTRNTQRALFKLDTGTDSKKIMDVELLRKQSMVKLLPVNCKAEYKQECAVGTASKIEPETLSYGKQTSEP